MARPLGYRVVLSIDKAPEIDESGTYVPEEYRCLKEAAMSVGTVMALGKMAFKGDDCQDDVKVGDKIYFRKYAGCCFRTKSGLVRVLNDRDCFMEHEEGDEEIINDTF